MFVLKRSSWPCVHPISLLLMRQHPARPKQMCSCPEKCTLSSQWLPRFETPDIWTMFLQNISLKTAKTNNNNNNNETNKLTKKTPCKTPPKTTPRKQMVDHAIVHTIYKIAEKKQIRRPWKIQHYINRNKQRRASVLKGGGRNVIALSLTVLVTLCTYQECILLSNIYHFWRSQVFLLQKDFSKCP